MTPVSAVAARAVAVPAVSFLVQKAVVMASGVTASTLPPGAATIASMAPALILRGGAAEVPFDLTRARIRLEGLHSYGVVTTLMLNASLRLFSSVPKPRGIVKGDKVNNVARILFTSGIICSILSGLFTTVVFSLLGMYAKTAIGMSKDVGAYAFFDATQTIRENAYHAFIVSLVSFNSSFILALFLNYEGKMRWWVACIAAAISLVSWYQWNSIMTIASQIIFT